MPQMPVNNTQQIAPQIQINETQNHNEPEKSFERAVEAKNEVPHGFVAARRFQLGASLITGNDAQRATTLTNHSNVANGIQIGITENELVRQIKGNNSLASVFQMRDKSESLQSENKNLELAEAEYNKNKNTANNDRRGYAKDDVESKLDRLKNLTQKTYIDAHKEATDTQPLEVKISYCGSAYNAATHTIQTADTRKDFAELIHEMTHCLDHATQSPRLTRNPNANTLSEYNATSLQLQTAQAENEGLGSFPKRTDYKDKDFGTMSNKTMFPVNGQPTTLKNKANATKNVAELFADSYTIKTNKGYGAEPIEALNDVMANRRQLLAEVSNGVTFNRPVDFAIFNNDVSQTRQVNTEGAALKLALQRLADHEQSYSVVTNQVEKVAVQSVEKVAVQSVANDSFIAGLKDVFDADKTFMINVLNQLKGCETVEQLNDKMADVENLRDAAFKNVESFFSHLDVIYDAISDSNLADNEVKGSIQSAIEKNS